MNTKMKKPTNPYSNDWAEYNNQNPHLHRSVGAEGDNDDDTSDNKVDVEALIKQAVGATVDGLKNNNTKLIDEKRILQAELDTYKAMGDKDNLSAMISQLKSAEEQQLIKDGQIDEVFERRTELLKVTQKAAIDERDISISELTDKLSQTNSLLDDNILTNDLMSAATKAGIADTALIDAISRARGVFKVQEGVSVALDSAGNPILGTKADVGLTPYEYFNTVLKGEAGHLYKDSTGAGMTGSIKRESLDAKIEAAASSNNMVEYRKLSEKLRQ